MSCSRGAQSSPERPGAPITFRFLCHRHEFFPTFSHSWNGLGPTSSSFPSLAGKVHQGTGSCPEAALLTIRVVACEACAPEPRCCSRDLGEATAWGGTQCAGKLYASSASLISRGAS